MFWQATGIGLIGGLAYYVAQIYWISQYLGPVPLIALAGIEAFFFAIGSGLIALATRTFLKPWVLALVVAGLWNGREWVATNFPYGGFPWSRVAMSQSNSPLAFWVTIGGFGILSFVIVALTILAIESLKDGKNRKWKAVSLATAATFLIPIGISQIPLPSEGSMRIAGVQGNANAGLFANVDRGTILQNHLDATDTLLSSGEDFDLVVWPENASDINPDLDAGVQEVLSYLVDKKLDAPFIFGTITYSGDEAFNSSKLWLPGRGEVDQYDKKRPVPFGEYVPDRDFYYQLAPDLIGLISRGYSFGTRDGIFEVSNEAVGILICFEVAIDEMARDLVAAGATVIVAQTNNADFGKSDESVQQLGITRLRAIEAGRSIVSISTVGPSQIFGPKGEILDESDGYVADYLVADVPLTSGKNLTMSGGWLFDPINASLAGLIAAYLIVQNRRRTTKL
jgi:apolipoprotein N-acyltransferase